MKHIHADLIHAWADGAQIQYRKNDRTYYHDYWHDCISTEPMYWSQSYDYRIKPEPKPDVVHEMHMTRFNSTKIYVDPNLRLTFDGETGKLKKAEVI